MGEKIATTQTITSFVGPPSKAMHSTCARMAKAAKKIFSALLWFATDEEYFRKAQWVTERPHLTETVQHQKPSMRSFFSGITVCSSFADIDLFFVFDLIFWLRNFRLDFHFFGRCETATRPRLPICQTPCIGTPRFPYGNWCDFAAQCCYAGTKQLVALSTSDHTCINKRNVFQKMAAANGAEELLTSKNQKFVCNFFVYGNVLERFENFRVLQH